MFARVQSQAGRPGSWPSRRSRSTYLSPVLCGFSNAAFCEHLNTLVPPLSIIPFEQNCRQRNKVGGGLDCVERLLEVWQTVSQRPEEKDETHPQ